MAKSGFDWLVVDMEHSALSMNQAQEIIRVIDLCNVTPLVRVMENNPNLIKRFMDIGAHGVIIPMVNSKSDAEKAVNAVKYPPIGRRSFGLARAQGYGAKFDDYLAWQRDNSLVIVQIEHIDAVNCLDSILSVDGVDAYFVGPYDLSGSLGVPGQFDHPEFLKAMDRIPEIAKKCEIPGGVHIVEPDAGQLKQSIERGNQFIAYGTDIRMLDTVCREGLMQVAGLRL